MELGEKTVKKNYVFKGKIINVRCDDAVLPNGKPCTREVVEHSGGASVLAVDKDDNCYLVKQFRYPYKEELLEIPAGKLNFGENPYDAALRELKEETGLIAKKLELLTTLYPSPGYTNEIIYIYLATDFAQDEVCFDEDEFLLTVKMPFKEAVEKIYTGEIKDAKTIAALLMRDKKQTF
ncbi:MAG: NUDIX hydrolase [Clostridiales bacterium]|nr:NUDIX hydrolase [Clostridiales bacterium]